MAVAFFGVRPVRAKLLLPTLLQTPRAVISKNSTLSVAVLRMQKKPFVTGADVFDMRRALSLTGTAELMRHMDVFIASCSAPLHIAIAVGLPCLAFYGPTSPAKWAPVHQCVYLYHRQPCAPCDRIGYGSLCKGESTCMRCSSPDEAIRAFSYLWEEKPMGQMDFCKMQSG